MKEIPIGLGDEGFELGDIVQEHFGESPLVFRQELAVDALRNWRNWGAARDQAKNKESEG